jgi:hypothetical protein
MSCAKKTPLLLALCALALLAWGCKKEGAGDPEWQRKKGELTDIHDLYTIFAKRNERPPKQLSELANRESEMISPGAVRGLQKEEYVVVWGLDVSGKDSGKVLAYEKKALEQGGAVLMANGTVKKMAADALKAALGK